MEWTKATGGRTQSDGWLVVQRDNRNDGIGEQKRVGLVLHARDCRWPGVYVVTGATCRRSTVVSASASELTKRVEHGEKNAEKQDRRSIEEETK
jgi:hypothetical protein